VLTGPEEDASAPCIMRGTIPPGVFVPLHSHADPETFVQISGEIEGLAQSARGSRWTRIAPGDVFHVPGEARHAFRNRSREPAVSIVVSTSKLGRFFRDIGIPLALGAPPPGPPSPNSIQHFLAIAERYGYWNATPEENAQIGIFLPPVS
jgi:quercetin dioxygenase-like cupin family protein